MRYLVLFAAWLLSAASYAQIEVPPQSEPYTFVEARAVLPVPDDPADVEHEISWTLPADCDVRQMCDGEELLIVGPPGKHTLGLTVKTRTYITRTVFVPDPEFPNDVTKAKIETLRIAAGIDLQTYSAEFTIGTPEPVPPPKPDPPPPDVEATHATYYYEKDDGPIPIGVTVALNKINRAGRVTATLFEEDATDADGNVPDQYQAGLVAARQSGLPALVVMAGDTVLAVVASPQTETDVLEAVP